jgi:hypothetical protein
MRKKSQGSRRAVTRGNGLVRFARGVRPDRNPLRRANDRLETLLLAGSIVTVAVGAPFAVPAAAAASHAAAVRTQAIERATRHEITGVLLQQATDTGDGYSADSQVLAQATWRAPDGSPRTGQVMATSGASKGSPIRIWTDPSGHLTGPPLTESQIAGQADLAGSAAAGGLVLLVLCESVIIRRLLDRRRIAAWDADWAVTEPMWNRQKW